MALCSRTRYGFERIDLAKKTEAPEINERESRIWNTRIRTRARPHVPRLGMDAFGFV